MKKLAFLLLLVALQACLSKCKPKVRVIVMPKVGSSSSTHALSKITESLRSDIFDVYPLVHAHDVKHWKNSQYTPWVYGNRDEYKAVKRKDELTRELTVMTHFSESGYLEALKQAKTDVIICDLDDYPCRKINSVLKPEKQILLMANCPVTWEEVFNIYPKRGGLINDFFSLVEKLLYGFGFLKRDDHVKEYRYDTLYFSQCPTSHVPLKPKFENVVPVGVFSKHPVSAKFTDEISQFVGYSDKVILVSLSKQYSPDVFLDAFKRYPLIKFIIKSDHFDIKSYSLGNVLAVDDINESEILANQQTKLFITDGEWEGIFASLYYGKPYVLIKTPTLHVIRLIMKDGKFAVDLSKSKLTADAIEEGIRTGLYDPQVRRAAEEFSKNLTSTDTSNIIYEKINNYVVLGNMYAKAQKEKTEL